MAIALSAIDHLSPCPCNCITTVIPRYYRYRGGLTITLPPAKTPLPLPLPLPYHLPFTVGNAVKHFTVSFPIAVSQLYST
jgi:hypothetical protein